ncbi:hypothetical protein S83_028458, partial [Arachis hypogaea]
NVLYCRYQLIEDKLELSKYLSWTFCSCTYGKRKPDTEFFMEAFEHLKVDLANCIFVDDRGPWGALSAIPEKNVISVNSQGGSVFSASGDSCAYCWDVETGKVKMVFKGHLDYLHCIVARNSSNQIITGSEDRTARIWDTSF